MLASTGGDGTARLWDVASRQALGAPLEPLEPVATAAFSQDGERLAAADLTGAARLWEVASGRVSVCQWPVKKSSFGDLL